MKTHLLKMLSAVPQKLGAGLFTLILLLTQFNGRAQTLLTESFDATTFPPTGWVVLNAGTGNVWVRGTTTPVPYLGAGYMQYPYNTASAANTWAFTPNIAMVSGTTYTLEYYQRVQSATFPENYRVTVGMGQTVAAQTTVLATYTGLVGVTYVKRTHTYACTLSGNYNFAFHCNSAADEYNLAIDEVTIFVPLPPATRTTTATGGLWTAPTTWVGGAVPSTYDTAIVATGATLTINTPATIAKMQLQNNATVFLNNTLTDSSDLIIGTGASYNSFFGTTGFQTTVCGNIANSGALNMAMPGASLSLTGSTSQSLSGSGTFSLIPTLTVNNGAGIVISPSLTVSNALTLTKGNISGAGTMTLGSLSFNPTFAFNSTGGIITSNVTSGLTGIIQGNATFTYGAPTPAASITTGNELNIAAASNLNVTFGAIAGGNYTLGSNIGVFNATINDTIDVGTNTMTVNGNASFNATANVIGAGTFTLPANATLTTTNLLGITAASATGSVRTTTRNYNAAANYTYNGAATQVTGDGLPATLTGGTVTINTTSGTTLTQTTQFYNLTLTTNLLTNGFNATVSNIGNLGTAQVSGTGGFVTTATTRLLLNNTNASGVLQNAPATNGNVINTGTRTFATGTDIVIGGSAVATGNGFPATGVDSLVLNQTTTLVVSAATSVNTLYITNTGRTTTTNANTLTVLGNAAGNVARNNSGYIDGPLTRTFGVGNSGTYMFPLGSGATGNLGIEVINPVVTGSNVTLTAVVNNMSSGGTAGTGLTGIATNRYWSISPVSGGTLTSVKNIRIYETSLAGLGTSKKVGVTTSNVAGAYNTIGGQLDSGAITILSSLTVPAFGTGTDSTYFVLGAGSATGAFTGGTFTVGPTGTYFSLTSAIAAINEKVSLTAPVILEFQTTYNSSVESYPIVFRSSLPTSATNTITIRPAAAVASVINFNGASFISTALFDFNGGSNIIIDGRPGGTGTNRYIAINQQSIGTFPSVRFINDAQNNTLRYVSVSGQNTSATSGLIVLSTGILAGNSNILIDNATINGMSNTANCIYAVGSTAPADNKNVTISNSNIYDFFINGGSNIGILANGGNANWTINANNFYQTAVRNSFSNPVMNSGTQFRAMNLNSSATNAVWTVTNNKIGGNISGVPGSVFVIGDSSSALGHTIRPIDISNAGTTAATSVQGNTISSMTLFTNGTDNFTGIGVLQAGWYNVGNVTPNTVGSTTANGSIAIYNRGTGALVADAYRFSGTSGGLLQNNIASGIDATVQGAQAAGGSTTFRGVTVGGMTLIATPNTLTVSGNTLGSTTLANSFRGLASSVGAVGFYGIFVTGATGAAVSVTNNTISNYTSFPQAFTTASSIRGIYITGASSISTIVSGNTIANLRLDAPNNATDVNSAVIGIINTTSGSGYQMTSNNTIHSLVSTYNGPVANVAQGIQYNSTNTSGISKIDRNVIHSLETGSTNNFAAQFGILVNGSATYVQLQNNFVRLGVNVNGTTNNANATFVGIYKQTASSVSAINNSVYIAGAPTNTDTLALSAAYFKANSAAIDTVMNNIFTNVRSNASGTGEHFAMYVNNVTGMRADANLCFANGTGGMLFRNGLTRISNMQVWRSLQKPWSQKSANANPLFNAGITNGASTINFTLQAASPAAKAGIALAFITTDQGGNARTATPAIGAYDLGLSALTATNDVYTPIFTYTKSGNRAVANTIFNNVSVSDIGVGVPTSGATAPKLWYKNVTTSSAWTSVQPTSSTGTGNAAVFSYTFSWTTIGTPSVSDKIYYYFVAQDAATTPNIWYSQYSATDPIHSAVGTQTTAPVSPDSFLIVTPLLTTVNIPVDYPSLTGTGGFFAAVNNASLGGNTTVTISADVVETGLNELRSDGMAGFSLTIQPDASPRALRGNSTTSLIRFNGVSKVTIDGGVNKNLRFVDSIGTSSSATVGATIEFFGGCSADTLVNCIVEGNGSTTTRGTVTFGAGINNNIVIANCDIRGIDSVNRPANAIYSNNIDNGNITIGGITARPGGNTIYDFTNAGINMVSAGDNIVVGSLTVPANGNVLYNRGAGSAVSFVNIGSSNNHTIANNRIYQKSGVYSGNITGVLLGGVTAVNGTRVTRNSMGGGTLDRSGLPITSTGGYFRGVEINAGAGTTSVVDSNYFSNLVTTGSAGVFGVYVSNGNVNVIKNIVGGAMNAHDTIQNGYDNGGIHINAGNNVLVQDNLISNLRYIKTGGDRTAGITIAATPVSLIVSRNIIHDIYHNGTGTTTTQYSAWGIIITSAPAGIVVDSNYIYNIYTTNATTGNYPSAGIHVVGNVTNSTFTRNRIYNVGSAGTFTGTAAPSVYGFFIQSGTGNTYANNQISVGTGAQAQAMVYGFYDASSSGLNTYTGNSIFINGTMAAGTNNSYGIYRSSTGNLFTRNNLIYNTRKGGTGKHYAIGSLNLAGVTGANIQYNMMFVADTAILAELPSGISNGWAGLGSLYTATYNTNWVEKTAAVPAEQLFIDTLVGNLGIVTSSTAAWYVNGKGIRIIGQTGDFASGVRSASITTGAVDIGSVEFTPTSLPPIAYADKVPAANDSTQFFFASRMVAKAVWGAVGSLPSTVDVRYYSGTNPANTAAGKTFMNAYWNIVPTGGTGYTYALTLMQDSSVLGTVTTVAGLGITRYLGTGTNWRLSTTGTASNNITGFMSTTGMNAAGIFTGTDINVNTLPVKYTSFSAVTKDDDAILSWTTASEINNKGFEIERSINGKDFEFVNFVKGAGNSTEMLDYNFIDAKAFEVSKVNTLYYRLKQVNFDAEYTYSNIVQVSKNTTELSTLTVYPNPYTSELNVSFTATVGNASIDIMDIQGRVVMSHTTATKAGLNTFPINKAAQLQSGIYFVRIQANGQTQVVKLVKN